MVLFTFLVKSIKYGGLCLAGLDANKQWVRLMKAGGFTEKDIIMDNGELMKVFNVVDAKLGSACPIKHHKENIKLEDDQKIKFIKKLNEAEQSSLLTEVTDTKLLEDVDSKNELYQKILDSGRSLVLTGPVDDFGIQNSAHPRIWIKRNNETLFYLTCTDVQYCVFVNDFFNNSEKFKNYFDLKEIDELKDKQVYFVIGLTGDSIKENGETKNGKFTPDESSIPPRYWPMIVSVLVIPNLP